MAPQIFTLSMTVFEGCVHYATGHQRRGETAQRVGQFRPRKMQQARAGPDAIERLPAIDVLKTHQEDGLTGVGFGKGDKRGCVNEGRHAEAQLTERLKVTPGATARIEIPTSGGRTRARSADRAGT